MLQIQSKNIDICRISKLLVKYNVKSSITNSCAILDGEISDELLMQLCDVIHINAIQNFKSQELLYLQKEKSTIKSDEKIQTEKIEKVEKIKSTEEKPEHTKLLQDQDVVYYNLLYPEVKRGEIYVCDFGEPYGSESGFIRYAIVIQNDDGNKYSPTTIVIPCTTKNKKRLSVHLNCIFSDKNIIDYDTEKVSHRENVIMAEQIQTVDKTRLREYIGRLTPEFMEIIDNKIKISLQLSERKENTENHQNESAKKTKSMNEVEESKKSKDVNEVQEQLLSLVDNEKIIKISQSKNNDETKVQEILDLFGFDFKKKGVQYLIKAIIISKQSDYFNVETLSEKVSQIENIDKEEIKRLIIARVKETFGFKKAPTIDFIRLVNNFLSKQEDDYEKNNI